jgi:hypothetical protein
MQQAYTMLLRLGLVLWHMMHKETRIQAGGTESYSCSADRKDERTVLVRKTSLGDNKQ